MQVVAPPVAAPVGWQRATRVTFRFCVAYFGLYVLVTQMLSGMLPFPVGGAPDIRHRAAEFAAVDGPSRAELLANLNAVFGEVERVLSTLTPEKLLERRTIQARDVSVLDAIFICVEHFALHLGQIILIAKQHAPGALQFYEDAGGLARPLWKEHVGSKGV